MIRSSLFTRFAPKTALKTVLGAAFAVACAAAPAQADSHGGAALSITQTIEIAASPDTVWARVGAFQDMSWHPAVFSAAGEGEEPGAARVLTLAEENGPTIAETLTNVEARAYSYRIDAVNPAVLPVTDYTATLAVTDSESGARVSWTGAFNAPDGIDDDVSEGAVAGVYLMGLEAVKTSLESSE